MIYGDGKPLVHILIRCNGQNMVSAKSSRFEATDRLCYPTVVICHWRELPKVCLSRNFGATSLLLSLQIRVCRNKTSVATKNKTKNSRQLLSILTSTAVHNCISSFCSKTMTTFKTTLAVTALLGLIRGIGKLFQSCSCSCFHRLCIRSNSYRDRITSYIVKC